MPQFERALDVGGIEDALEGCFIRFQVLNDLDKTLVNSFQAKRELVGGLTRITPQPIKTQSAPSVSMTPYPVMREPVSMPSTRIVRQETAASSSDSSMSKFP